jgi:DNA-directed RNA polymerase beta subunit
MCRPSCVGSSDIKEEPYRARPRHHDPRVASSHWHHRQEFLTCTLQSCACVYLSVCVCVYVCVCVCVCASTWCDKNQHNLRARRIQGGFLFCVRSFHIKRRRVCVTTVMYIARDMYARIEPAAVLHRKSDNTCLTTEESLTKKQYFLGYVCHRLLACSLGRRPPDERDHYANKRVDMAGPLLAGEMPCA